jgi:hypothetical protein
LEEDSSELTTYRILGTSEKAFSKGIENCEKGIIRENISLWTCTAKLTPKTKQNKTIRKL